MYEKVHGQRQLLDVSSLVLATGIGVWENIGDAGYKSNKSIEFEQRADVFPWPCFSTEAGKKSPGR